MVDVWKSQNKIASVTGSIHAELLLKVSNDGMFKIIILFIKNEDFWRNVRVKLVL